MKSIDHEIISHLRMDARKPIPVISKEVGAPSSTIYEKIKRQYKGLFKRHVTLVNFQNLGYHTIVHFAISCKEGDRLELKRYLLDEPRINTLHRVNFGWDYLAEGIFKNFAEAEDFKTLLRGKFSPKTLECFNVVEELKKEQFLTKPEHFED